MTRAEALEPLEERGCTVPPGARIFGGAVTQAGFVGATEYDPASVTASPTERTASGWEALELLLTTVAATWGSSPRLFEANDGVTRTRASAWSLSWTTPP